MKMWAIILLAIGIMLLVYYSVRPLSAKIRIRNRTITVDVAATIPEKIKGLGGRSSMPELHGMLFPYDHKEQYGFWMMGMKFPLDFIWIDGNVVADITENVPNPKGLQTPVSVQPKVPVDKILEVNAGMVKKWGIKIGDRVTFLDK